MTEYEVIKEIADGIKEEKREDWLIGASFVLDMLSQLYPDFVNEVYFLVGEQNG